MRFVINESADVMLKVISHVDFLLLTRSLFFQMSEILQNANLRTVEKVESWDIVTNIF